MSCGCYSGYNCGCGNYGNFNTVQYAPSACNPNFPTSCTSLGEGVIQRLVGEDSASCKYTVPTLNTNSLLYYNASTGLVNWGDGSTTYPLYLTLPTNQATVTSGQIQALSSSGELVGLFPTASTEAQFPVVSAGQSTTTWGTVESIIPTQGLVYKTGSSSSPANTVQTLSTTTAGQVVSFNTTTGDPQIVSASSLLSSIPTGAVLPFAYSFTSGNTPSGWLICDGTQYSTSAYPALYALIGTSYGSGVGTFAVPNLQGLFIRGKGTQTTGGVTYTSAAIGTAQQDQFQGHYHAVSSTAIQGAGPGGAVGNPGGNFGGATINVTNPTTDGTDGTPRYGTETRPVNYAMIYCIKT